MEEKFRIRQNVRMIEAARNQTKFEPPQIYAITEVKPPYVYLKVKGTKSRHLKRHMKNVYKVSWPPIEIIESYKIKTEITNNIL
uniref:C2 domain-containing protein n=1 Tax=Strongyloides venezuelensis TaxID=75913 RepID=A0A0K0FQG1_STRVS